MKPKKKKPATANAKKPTKRSSTRASCAPTTAPQEATTPATTSSSTRASCAPTTAPQEATTPATTSSSTSEERAPTTQSAPVATITMSSLVAAATAAMVAFSAEALRLALEFVLIACPKEGPFSVVVFDTDEYGTPLVAAHDRVRCHVAFMPKNAWCLARGSVARANIRKLVKLLRGLDRDDNDTVTVSSSGRVEVQRLDQATLPHRLDFKTLEPGLWQPPRDLEARATHAPLVLPSDRLQRAVRYPEAVIRIEQRTSARVVVNVERGGELVARAIIAEQGHELYPSDPPAQTTFEFSESARSTSRAAIPESVKRAADDLRAKLQRRDEEELAAPEAPSASEVAMTFPEPGEKPVVVEIPEEVFDELSPEAIESLRLPPGVEAPLFWFNLPDRRTSPVLAASMARAVGEACSTLGLVCADVSAGRRHGVECSVWTVAKGGA